MKKFLSHFDSPTDPVMRRSFMALAREISMAESFIFETMISCADDNLRCHETCVRSVKGIKWMRPRVDLVQRLLGATRYGCRWCGRAMPCPPFCGRSVYLPFKEFSSPTTASNFHLELQCKPFQALSFLSTFALKHTFLFPPSTHLFVSARVERRNTHKASLRRISQRQNRRAFLGRTSK